MTKTKKETKIDRDAVINVRLGGDLLGRLKKFIKANKPAVASQNHAVRLAVDDYMKTRGF